ncbi:hypothetical protein PN36_20305 [Candidatus Thiomargarita nelsonii]|uniref:GmrSD restriction endonucleases N-terminal domain-containing protein n=1 Tax=Candidatus Thiomargarita nelsonii TaxID=1003181 RepID=A0A4E0QPS3_9GAMM|nr:hypothetical protein PN36_20305 [Candidatus Thiomargarita nelsonii]
MNQEKINTSTENVKQDLAADGRPAGVEDDQEEMEAQEPFDPEKISIEPKVVPMDTLIRRLQQGSIRLAPAFQRKEIWDSERKSQLIESLMLKIPIPMFYVASDEKGHWDVVDGLQRLTTIKEFILGNEYMKTRDKKHQGQGFRLQSLEFWGEKYNDSTFKELPNFLINRILETEFRFTIINPRTPEEVKRNIFKRINTGGMPLTPQEIRHALYQGKSTELLSKLVETTAFKEATAETVNDSRMAARELILRFLAFSIRSYKNYPKSSNMDIFISDTMRLINIMPELPKRELNKIFKNSPAPPIRFNDIEILKQRFIKGMKRAYKLFQRHTFRKSFEKRRSPINKTLLEVWGNLLADLDDERFECLMSNKNNLSDEYHKLLGEQNFVNSISRNSLNHSEVQSRYDRLTKIVEKYSIGDK